MHFNKLLTAAIAALGLTLAPLADAQACGGFFCNTTPILQDSERIIFGVNQLTNETTMHVQISYSGAAADFAWIVPVASPPEIKRSTDSFFQQIGGWTQPYFWLNSEEEGTCEWDGCDGFGGMCWDMMASADGGGVPGDPSVRNENDDGVTVVDQQVVGPYQTVTLQANSSDELLLWLNDNDYLLPESLGDALNPYIAEDSYFVALRLTNNADVGDLAPLALTYAGNKPMIPIQLTSIAASPDMRLEVYLLSDNRGVPDNYLHVQINEAAIDWIGGGQNYEDVVTLAADEAGGHAFATDFAGSTTPFHGLLYEEGRWNLDSLRNISDPSSMLDAIRNQGLPRDSAMLALLQKHIPMPQSLIDNGTEERDFYNCLSCYSTELSGFVLDSQAMIDDLDLTIVQPLADAEALVAGHPYLSRLSSSVSPEEMTVDPMFAFNPDMDDVANEHIATLVYLCGNGGTYNNSPREIRLQDGTVINLPPQGWLIDNGMVESDFLDALSSPAALTIERTGAAGQPLVLTDNTSALEEVVRQHNDNINEIAGNGCSASGTRNGLFSAMFVLLGLAIRRRRHTA